MKGGGVIVGLFSAATGAWNSSGGLGRIEVVTVFEVVEKGPVVGPPSEEQLSRPVDEKV